ncbi:MAG: hypothetical protein OES79_03325 [Planctomycetota bacterium]|nr:hypothetical protein [Planctomycetota bacterium]
MSGIWRGVFLLGLLGACPLWAVSAEDAERQNDQKPAEAKLSAAERKFQQTMSGAVLVGHFTTMGAEPADKLNEERYAIRKVSKLADKQNTWRFFVRIQYGELDVTLPLDLEVFWAADTPVITLTNFTIPALGTFSARVLVYGQRYAGTWQHGDKGGHLFGRVVKDEKE